MSYTPRLGILGSGSGSNCQSLFEAIDQGRLHAEVAVVMSDRPDAYILQRAERWNVRSEVIDCRGYKSKFPDESQSETAMILQESGVDLVCLAGFMRLVREPLLSAFPDRILNIHPSLLPAYPGLEAWKQALEDGATQTGVTVHYVDCGMDTGKIIEQVAVPVLPDDTPESLHERIQVQEHILYPQVVDRVLREICPDAFDERP